MSMLVAGTVEARAPPSRVVGARSPARATAGSAVAAAAAVMEETKSRRFMASSGEGIGVPCILARAAQIVRWVALGGSVPRSLVFAHVGRARHLDRPDWRAP